MVSAIRKYQFGKTTILYGVMITFAFMGSFTGPSIPDLCERMGITEAEISIAFSLNSAAWVIGGIAWGPIIDRVQDKTDVILGVCMALVGLTTLIKGFAMYLWMYTLGHVCESLAVAGADLAANSVVFSIWGEEANSPMQGLHAAWGLGNALGPFIILPFLGPDKDDGDAPTYNASTIATDTTMSNFGLAEEESRIQIAFSIVAVISFAISLSVFIFKYCVRIPEGMVLHLKPKDSMAKVFSLDSIADGDKRFAVTMLAFVGILYFTNAGREGVFGTWLFSYAVDSELDFSKSEAAVLDAAAKFAYFAGRLLTTFIALKVAIQPMLFTEVYMVMVIVLCLMFFGTRSKTNLYIFACLHNLFSAPIWPGGFNWTNQYIVVSGIVFMFMNIGSGLAGFFFQWLAGWLFTNRTPGSVVYIMIGCAATLCVLLVVMQIIASNHGVRFSAGDTEKEKNNMFGMETLANAENIKAPIDDSSLSEKYPRKEENYENEAVNEAFEDEYTVL